MHKINNISFTITKKRGLKHLYIYVKEGGVVEVRSPYLVSKKRIYQFVESKSEWIQKRLLKMQNIPREEQIDKDSLKQKAKELIDPLVEKWSKKMGVTPTNVGYRYNKSRWGSCSAKNRLNFNTKLAMMHRDFVEYVVVHELAHIRHKNHSREFWDEVREYLPDYKERKKLIFLNN